MLVEESPDLQAAMPDQGVHHENEDSSGPRWNDFGWVSSAYLASSTRKLERNYNALWRASSLAILREVPLAFPHPFYPPYFYTTQSQSLAEVQTKDLAFQNFCECGPQLVFNIRYW